MITRPLDLASRLRPEPRSTEALFYVNAGLIVLFFALFGSRFVLAPGLGVDFRLPKLAGANANAKAPTHVISVTNSGQIFASDGLQKMDELTAWLMKQGAATRAPVLLVRIGTNVPTSLAAEIFSSARRAGFEIIWAAEEAGVTARGGR